MKAFATVVLVAVAVLMSTAQAVDIGISPARLAITATPGQTVVKTVTVFSTGGSSQEIGVSTTDFTLDDVGTVKILPAGSLDFSDASWITLGTSDLTLAGGTQRPVRLSVTVPANVRLGGTYNAMVFFRVIPTADRPAAKVGVVQTARIGLAVYVTVAGTEKAGSHLTDLFQAGDRSVGFTVDNTGNTLMRLSGKIELRDASGAAKYTLDVSDTPVLRGSQRTVTVAVPRNVEPGYYVALALLKDDRGLLLSGQTAVTIR